METGVGMQDMSAYNVETESDYRCVQQENNYVCMLSEECDETS